jgi:hypothetical protein
MSLLYEKIVQEDLNVGLGAAVTVTNPGGGTLTGTQIGLHSVAVGQRVFTATWNPDNVTAGSYTSTTIAIPGAAVDDFVLVRHDAILTNVMILSGHVSAANIVTVILFNPTGGAINIGSGELGVLVFKARE